MKNKISYSKMKLNTHLKIKWVFNKENGRPILFFIPNFNFPSQLNSSILFFQQKISLNSYNKVWEIYILGETGKPKQDFV
jgi:hypothetical protein